MEKGDLNLIVVSESGDDYSAFRELLDRAEHAGTVDNFLTLVTHPHVSSEKIREHFGLIKRILTEADHCKLQ
ncbi:MAG TPA: hypothetical protein VF884_03805 [Nitrososphaeraceae archaeon]